MSLNDNATLVIGNGNFLLSPVGTPIPSDLLSPVSPWDNVGHTSLEDIFGITSEGGEATVLGTLQSKNLRTRYSPRSESFNFTLQQFDEPSLKLFFGSNMIDVNSGQLLGVPQDPTATIRAFLAIFIDAENVFAFYAPKAEILRGDDMSLSDTESLAGLPLSVKPVNYGSNEWAYAITPLRSIVLPTGATAGTPGAFTPNGAVVPASLAALQAGNVTASPATSWTTGQYVNLGDASKAHWNGTAYATGPKA